MKAEKLFSQRAHAFGGADGFLLLSGAFILAVRRFGVCVLKWDDTSEIKVQLVGISAKISLGEENINTFVIDWERGKRSTLRPIGRPSTTLCVHFRILCSGLAS